MKSLVVRIDVAKIFFIRLLSRINRKDLCILQCLFSLYGENISKAPVTKEKPPSHANRISRDKRWERGFLYSTLERFALQY
jgi:hypothetical protein